ncbi:MAG TPA: AI-2E family transporter [Corynebacterium sp.]|nr:AI-2E family transporter [Corynebacterium sp.]
MGNHQNNEPGDFADQLPELVEGPAEDSQPDQPPRATPRVPAASSAKEVYDRSTIIAGDGKVMAGWALRFIVVVIATYIALQLLSYVWVGLLPVLLALIITTVLWPPTRWLRNHRVPAALAALLSIVVFLALIIGTFVAMAPTVRNQGSQIVDQLIEGVNSVIDWAQGPPLNLDTGNINLDEAITDAIAFLQEQSQNIISGLSSGISIATTVVATMFITAVITFFMLKDGDRFLPMLRRYTGASAGWHLSEVLTRSWNTLSGFIRTQALVSFVDALFIGIGLFILQVPLALVLAVITFFAGFIPIVGAFTAGALAVIIALVTNGFTNALLVLAVIIVVQQVEGNVLQPVLQSKAMNLHAAIVLLSVTVGSALFGILGAFLAVPIAAVVAVWIRYHSEMVALRAGEITVDDIEIATSRGQSMSSREAFLAVRDHLRSIGVRKPAEGGSTAASKSEDEDLAETATESDLNEDTRESAPDPERN